MTPTSNLQQWKQLYQKAEEFKALAPWEWMFDSDLFGVVNPDTGEIGYCCIMGSLGEYYAMTLYKGSRGLHSYFRLAEAADDREIAIERFLEQECIKVSFENREDLKKKDRDLIKQLGLKFRGAGNWPLFRDYSAGWFPWYLEEDQVSFLCTALDQAMVVANRMRNDEKLLYPPDENENQFLVRVPSKKGKSLEWHDEWRIPEPYRIYPTSILAIDNARIQKILNIAKPVTNTLEFGWFHIHEGVMDDSGRPFYPLMNIAVETESKMIVFQDLMSPTEKYSKVIPNLLRMIESLKIIPGELRVNREEMFYILEEVCNILNIELLYHPHLNDIDVAKRELFKVMGLH